MWLTDPGFQAPNHCCCFSASPPAMLESKTQNSAKHSNWSLAITVQSGGITSCVLDIEFCLCFSFLSSMQHMSHTNPSILFCSQIPVNLLFYLLEWNILLTSSVKWYENKVIWIYSKQQEAPFKIPSPATQDLSKCFKTVCVGRAAPITQ